MIKTDFIKLYEELNNINEGSTGKNPEYYNSFEVDTTPRYEPEITFNFFGIESIPSDGGNPPDEVDRNDDVTIPLSQLVDFLDSYMTDEEYNSYEKMVETHNWKEEEIKSWVEKYFDKADEDGMNKTKEEYLEKEYIHQRQRQDEIEYGG